MLRPAICSITFRDLKAATILDICREAKLEGIEWGGDVHVPHGDFATAKAVGALTREAGIEISAYGSYYRCDESKLAFADVLQTALALKAPVIRVWAGEKGSEAISPEERTSITDALRNAVDAATKAGLNVALEYHRNTLTDTCASAHQLLTEVDRQNLKLFWQPRIGATVEANLIELRAALPHLANVHCFHWGPGGYNDRFTLREGEATWRRYLQTLQPLEGDRYITLEFVKNNSPEQCLEDARTLRDLLSTLP